MSRIFEWYSITGTEKLGGVIQEFFPREAKNIKSNLFLMYKAMLPGDIIWMFVWCLCRASVPSKGCVIGWISKYLKVPFQIRRNPLIFVSVKEFEHANMCLLNAESNVETYVKSFMVDTNDTIHVETGLEEYLEVVLKPKEVTLPHYNLTCNHKPITIEGVYANNDIPRYGDLFLGFIIKNPTNVKHACIEFMYSGLCVDFDLNNPIMMTKYGALYSHESAPIPLFLLPYEAVNYRIELYFPDDNPNISFAYGCLESKCKKTVAEKSFMFEANGKTVLIANGVSCIWQHRLGFL